MLICCYGASLLLTYINENVGMRMYYAEHRDVGWYESCDHRSTYLRFTLSYRHSPVTYMHGSYWVVVVCDFDDV